MPPLLKLGIALAIGLIVIAPFSTDAAPQDPQSARGQNAREQNAREQATREQATREQATREQATRERDSKRLPLTEPAEPYIITLSEYHLQDTDASNLTEDRVLAAIEEQNARPAGTIVLSATPGVESSIHFGRRITVTVGISRSSPQAPPSRHTQEREIGTRLSLLATPVEQQVAVQLTFQSSHPVGEGTDESPPDISNHSIETTLFLEPGKPRLIGGATGATAGKASNIHFLLTVTR